MEGNLTQEKPKKQESASEIFKQAFPIYIAMGMTYAEFWERESWLVKSYREANRLKSDEMNKQAWMSGLYFLQALHSGVPVVVKGFAKNGGAPLEQYPEKPIEFQTDKKAEEDKRMKTQVARMKEMAERFNAVFKRKSEQSVDK